MFDLGTLNLMNNVTYESAFNMGAAAAKSGRKLSDNPFPTNTTHASRWAEGWQTRNVIAA